MARNEKKNDKQNEVSTREPMTEENFFNVITEVCPDAMKVFLTWIDLYYARSNWNLLFNVAKGYRTAQGEFPVAPKYHELPLAIQTGIWLEFLMEFYKDEKGTDVAIDDVRQYDVREDISTFMETLQTQLDQAKAK